MFASCPTSAKNLNKFEQGDIFKINIASALCVLTALVLSGCIATTSPTIQRASGEILPVKLEVSLNINKVRAPTILIGHGANGVGENNTELARILNAWGYNSVIIDHYTLRGISPHTGNAINGLIGPYRALDFIESARWVLKQEWHQGKVAVVGFSQGGAGVLTLINDRTMRNLDYISDENPNPLSVAVAYYPSCGLSPVPSNPSMPTQIHLAEDDDLDFISTCQFQSDNPYEVHIYKGATHSFDARISQGARLIFTHRYDVKSTNESRDNLKRFLDSKMR